MHLAFLPRVSDSLSPIATNLEDSYGAPSINMSTSLQESLKVIHQCHAICPGSVYAKADHME